MNDSTRLMAIWLLVLVSGCQHTFSKTAPGEPEMVAVSGCHALVTGLDQRIVAEGQADAGVPRVRGFPWLRTNRFLASVLDHADTPAARTAWLRRASTLALETLMLEAGRLEAFPVDAAALAGCRDTLLAAVTDAAWALIREHAQVPDDYSLAKRFVGLYPLLALPFRAAVARDQRDSREREILAPSEQSGLRDYVPLTAVTVPVDLARVARDPLGIPLMTRADEAALLARHAPVVTVPAAETYDRMVTPMVRGESVKSRDVPVLYTFIDHGLHRQVVTTRLNYAFWFPARPPSGRLDLLAGRFDGLIWRVHLDETGTPLAFDAVHHCGCWYQLYPAEGYVVPGKAGALEEPVLVGAALGASGRKRLILDSGSHALVAVQDWDGRSRASVPLRPYDDLKRLDDGGRSRSLFDHRGLVPGTERLERFLFWPMGIRSAGQMRVVGTHAIAFVGRRHFDDPGLLEVLGLERSMVPR